MKKPWLVQYILNVLCGFWTDRILAFLRPWARSQRAREPRSLSSKEGRRRQSQAWSANTWWSTNGARWWVRRWILVLLRFCFPTKMVTYYLKKTTFNLDWPSHDFFLIFPITNPLWLGNREDFLVVPSANPRNAAGKNRFKQISAWINACQSARNELGIKGMCCVGGKTVQGKALYVKAKAIFGKWARAVPVSCACQPCSEQFDSFRGSSWSNRSAVIGLFGTALSLYSQDLGQWPLSWRLMYIMYIHVQQGRKTVCLELSWKCTVEDGNWSF